MTNTHLAIAATALVLLAAAAPSAAQEAPTAVPLDTETTIGGVAVACTGIGQEKADPRWKAYPIRVEFAKPGGDYLANGAVAVSGVKGGRLAAVSCEGPWVLLRPGPGAYTIEGWLPGTSAKPRSGAFRIPTKGQVRLVLVFPEA